ncbi:MAG: site-specific integrase, partial [Lentisphaeria bacterium]|nr:site-specific integrase [Lentisphaeria bacterium]
MQEYVVNRPDEGAMERILQKNFDNAAGVILRLAWQAGLLRDEIEHLTWAQIDFLDSCIVLPDRSVPIPEELADYLLALRDGRNRRSETVVLSDRDQKPLKPQSISRLARTALDTEDQTAIRLIDLRHDFVLRRLEEHDWQY